MPTPPRKWGTKKEASFSTASTNPNSPTRKQIWGTRSLGSSASWQGGRFFPHHCLQDLPVPKTLLQKSIGDLGYYLDGICFYVLISLEMGALNKSPWNYTGVGITKLNWFEISPRFQTISAWPTAATLSLPSFQGETFSKRTLVKHMPFTRVAKPPENQLTVAGREPRCFFVVPQKCTLYQGQNVIQLIYLFVCLYVQMYIYIYTCIYVNMYIHIHIYRFIIFYLYSMDVSIYIMYM